MSLRITKAGLLDTIQDGGRNGYAHLGISTGGAMDRFSYELGNALLGNHLNAPSIELHFPASNFLFEEAMIICLTGADFSAQVDGHDIPLHHPVALPKHSLLQFRAWRSGARCYLAFAKPLRLQPWLGSYSTHLKASAGGIQGRALQKGDVLHFEKSMDLRKPVNEIFVLPWSSGETIDYRTEIQCLIGNEWSQLTYESQLELQSQYFQITANADRMGYRLAGGRLERNVITDILSSGVTFGTVQLLPNGQLIILMADHQTTGGYPRIAQVISAHLPLLAQKKPNDVLTFALTDLATAERKTAAQEVYLADLQLSCAYQMETLKREM
jgi:antagonist of KipI